MSPPRGFEQLAEISLDIHRPAWKRRGLIWRVSELFSHCNALWLHYFPGFRRQESRGPAVGLGQLGRGADRYNSEGPWVVVTHTAVLSPAVARGLLRLAGAAVSTAQRARGGTDRMR